MTTTFGYVDVNPDPVGNMKGDLLYEVDAIIYGSLRNLFSCPEGERGRIFRPAYKTSLFNMLQEPFDDLTAAKIKLIVVQEAQVWEPRIEILMGATSVTKEPTIPGYKVVLGFRIVGEGPLRQASYILPV